MDKIISLISISKFNSQQLLQLMNVVTNEYEIEVNKISQQIPPDIWIQIFNYTDKRKTHTRGWMNNRTVCKIWKNVIALFKEFTIQGALFYEPQYKYWRYHTVFTNINTLYVTNISSLDLRSFTNLTKLSFGNGLYATDHIGTLTNLTSVNLQNNWLFIDNLIKLPKLTKLKIKDCWQQESFTSLSKLQLCGVIITNNVISKLTTLTSLSVFKNGAYKTIQFTKDAISHLTNLTNISTDDQSLFTNIKGSFYQNNKLVYQGDFMNGKYHGQGMLISNGIKYEGNFVNGEFITN
jgi:hypothetical protein